MKPQNKLYTGRELIAHAVAVDEFQGFKYIDEAVQTYCTHKIKNEIYPQVQSAAFDSLLRWVI